MNSEPKNPFDLLIDQIRAVVAEEITKALNERKPGKIQFTLEEAAQILNVQKSWLGGKVRAGELPHHRPENSHRIFFTQQDIDEIVASSQVRPKSNGGPK